MGESKRDFEFCGLVKNPYVSLHYQLTVEGYDGLITEGYKSPAIELYGAKLNFILTRNQDNYNRCGNNDSIKICTDSPISVSGYVTVNEKKHSIDKKKLKAGSQETSILVYTSITNLSVAKFDFDLKVYGLVKQEFILTKKGESKIDEDQCRKNLQDNVLALWQSQEFSDVRIQVGKESLTAHKIILSARSPVFSRMFRNFSVESQENVVEVEDVSFDVLKVLVGFLYGLFPDLSTMPDELFELYYASDKYEVLDLRDLCGEALVEGMTTDNVCELIQLFCLHSHLEYLKRVVDFCCVNLKDVVQLREWDQTIQENPDFSCLMMKKMAKIRK